MTRKPAKPTTLSEVAVRAGVSIATASKALNDRHDVGSQTRVRVQQTAQEMGFQPNVIARGLTSGRSRTVGLLTGELDSRFSVPLLRGIENTLGAGEMSVLLCDARGDAIREQHYLRTLMARQVDGLIVMGQNTNPRPSVSDGATVPVLYAYGPSDDPRDVSFVPDDRGGGRLAAEHLIALGRHRIAHISGPEAFQASHDRTAGVVDALDAAGLVLAGATRHGDWSQRWGRQATEMLLVGGAEIDAIFCASDQIATGASETLYDHGIRVPEDVALVGFDNWKVFSTESRPPLTTVDMNLDQLGAVVARHLLIALDRGIDEGTHRQPCRLVVRESTALTRPPASGRSVPVAARRQRRARPGP